MNKYFLLRRSIMLVLTILLLAALGLLRTDQALAGANSVECIKSHTVKAGDTLGKLAVEYKVSLTEMANANQLTAPYTIYVGQSLCVPKAGTVPQTPSPTAVPGAVSSANFTVTRSSDKLTVQIKNFPKNTDYFVRARSAQAQGPGAWERIGSLQTDKNGAATSVFTLGSKDLKNASLLSVCVKNVLTNDMQCTTSVNTGSQPPPSGTPGGDGSFLATLKRDKVNIVTKNLPANSTYFVRISSSTGPRSAQWVRIGSLQVANDGSISKVFVLPAQFDDVLPLRLCLKNVVTDAVICTTISQQTQ